MLCDEATSALDAESEQKIQRAVDELSGSMTVLIVTHRLATVRNTDDIYVLEEGKLVEESSWDDFVRDGGRLSEIK